MNFVTLFTGCY